MRYNHFRKLSTVDSNISKIQKCYKQCTKSLVELAMLVRCNIFLFFISVNFFVGVNTWDVFQCDFLFLKWSEENCKEEDCERVVLNPFTASEWLLKRYEIFGITWFIFIIIIAKRSRTSWINWTLDTWVTEFANNW